MVVQEPEPPRPTRNTERTRRAVLDAAARAITERGTAVTLGEVASLAGISKSGLLHHFSSRDQLITAVVEDVNARFREAVLKHLDLSENYPGKMLRAYVRALCGGDDETVTEFFTSSSTWNGVYLIPSAAAVQNEDSAWWAEQFAVDGLSIDRIQLVRRAAEGVAAAAAYGEETERQATIARDHLLELATQGTFRAPL